MAEISVLFRFSSPETRVGALIISKSYNFTRIIVLLTSSVIVVLKRLDIKLSCNWLRERK